MKKTKVYFTKEITSKALVKLYKKLNIELPKQMKTVRYMNFLENKFKIFVRNMDQMQFQNYFMVMLKNSLMKE